MKFKGDIIITDPCYIIKDNSDDWNKCGWGENMGILGFTTYISEYTLCGVVLLGLHPVRMWKHSWRSLIL